MSTPGNKLKDSAMKLLPHQSAFLETFFNPASKRVIVLSGDVGLGKSAALVALASRLLQERPKAHVLFLGPKGLLMYILESSSDAAFSCLLVDRYRYRQMIDATNEGELWPAGTVVVMSIDFAKQSDIQDSLAATRWDLVIVDEAHLVRGARAEALRRVGACAERVVLASATSQELEPPHQFPDMDATVVEWRRDRVVDQDGKPFKPSPLPTLHEITYSPNSAELRLRETIGGLCEILQGAFGAKDFRVLWLLRTLESSPVALEGTLQQLVAGTEARQSGDTPWEASEEDVLENRLPDRLDRSTAEKVAEITERALQEIEAIDSDSKLGAFSGLLNDLSDAKKPSRRICVLTQYSGTFYYLAAEIEGRGMACQRLHGEMGHEERVRSLTQFANAGNLLVATSALMTEGVTFAEVTDLILYDIPGSKSALQQVMGRFDRFGRVSQLNVFVLAPSNAAEGFTSEPLQLLREILGSETLAQPTH